MSIQEDRFSVLGDDFVSVSYSGLVYVLYIPILQMCSLEPLSIMCRTMLQYQYIICHQLLEWLQSSVLETSEDVQCSTFRKPGDINPGP